MKDVLRLFWEAVGDLWDELFLLAPMNIVTALLAVLVITLPPALAGLWNVANRVTQGKAAGWSDYFEGFRRYFWKAWGLALLNILLVAIAITNLWFYMPDNVPFEIHSTLSLWIRALWIAVTFLWLALQMYPLALLLEQEDQRLWVTLRNTVVIFIANPGFTLILAVLLLVVAAFSTLLSPLWFFLTPALFAVVCNKTVQHLLKPYRTQTQTEG
ncbi:MAG: DUF624 domain-containing protein [Chloroflexota bacterium]|nr:DUF624 domain-containing protein [Chloroflexota bacterium]